MLLEAPNAVDWKKSSLVSKGKSIGQEEASSSHQSGMAEALNIKGSWICWTNLFVIYNKQFNCRLSCTVL